MSVYVPNSIGQYFERRQNKLAIATEFGLLARRDSDPRFIAQVKRLDAAMKGLPVKVGSNLAKRLGRKVLRPAAAKYRGLWLAERPKRPTNKVRRDIAKAIVHSADVRAGLVVATTGVKVNRSSPFAPAGITSVALLKLPPASLAICRVTGCGWRPAGWWRWTRR